VGGVGARVLQGVWREIAPVLGAPVADMDDLTVMGAGAGAGAEAGGASTTTTSRPAMASARATARPTTPAPPPRHPPPPAASPRQRGRPGQAPQSMCRCSMVCYQVGQRPEVDGNLTRGSHM
jgi:hypothetical protein